MAARTGHRWAASPSSRAILCARPRHWLAFCGAIFRAMRRRFAGERTTGQRPGGCEMASTTSVAKINDKSKQKKYFSLGEARRALVLVRRVTSDVQNTQANRLKLHAAIALGAGKLKPMHMERLQNEFEFETERLETLIEELTK